LKKIPVKVKKLHPDAKLPVYASDLAAGADLYSYLPPHVEYLELKPGTQVIVDTGLAFSIPPGYEMQIRGRSGLAVKYAISITHGIGTIDADYRGEVKVFLYNHGTETIRIGHHERIAQAIFNEVPVAEFIEVDELDETDRGTNGFGSTGI
jgi:dUTP pyrophosphatase